MALQGNLQDFGLADILQLLGSQEKTGVLTVTRRDEHVSLAFLRGCAVHADSNRRTLRERLGAKLVTTGKLSPDALAQALEQQKGSDSMLGQVLIRERLAEPEAVWLALKIQISEIIFDVLRWSDGSFDFAQSETVNHHDNFTPMGVQGILMDGMRRIDEWPMIEKRIRSYQMVLHQVPEEEDLGETLSGIDNILDEIDEPAVESRPDPKAELTGLQKLVLERVDGRATIRDIIDKTLMGDFDVCRAIYDLWNLNLVGPAYEGSLSELSFPELVHAICVTEASGQLEIRQGDTKKNLAFVDGRFISAASNDPDEALGTYLFTMGMIDGSLLKELAGCDDPRALGTIISSRSGLSEADLRPWMLEHMSQVIVSLFEWTDGTYSYRPDLAGKMLFDSLSEETPALVLRGVRGIRSWSRVSSAVRGPDVFRLRADLAEGLAAGLTEPERAILESFAEPATLQSACELQLLSDFDVHLFIWAMQILGWLERQGDVKLPLRHLIAAIGSAELNEGPEDESWPAVPSESQQPPEPVGKPTGIFAGDSFAALLREFYFERKTGVLSAASGSVKNRIFLSHGSIVGASSSARDQRLGDALVNLGLLDRTIIDTLLQECPNTPLGQEILNRCLLSREDLNRGLESQIRAVIVPMFNWGQTPYYLQEEDSGHAELAAVDLSSAEIIMMGAQSMDNVFAVRAAVSDYSVRLAPSEDPRLRFQTARLRSVEGYILSRVDGQTSIGELVMLSPVGEEETQRIIYGLLETGLVEAVLGDVVRPIEPPVQFDPEPMAPGDEELIEAVARLAEQNHFEVLGVEPGADLREIGRGYRDKAKLYHPDRGRSGRQKQLLEVLFARVIEAGRVLRDGRLRSTYETKLIS